MITNIPLLPLPYKPLRGLLRLLYPASALLSRLFPSIEADLEEAGSQIPAKDYLSGALLSSLLYLALCDMLLAGVAYRREMLDEPASRLAVFFISLAFSMACFLYALYYPRYAASKKRAQVERNLLFAARHLMVQTTAGVPLFDAIASISEDYADDRLNYSGISAEFRKIIKEARSGKDFSTALEQSASRSPSKYYRRILWQLANTNRSGGDMGHALRESVDFLSEEQRIMIRNYGSQLNPLALFYMMVCVIAPNMGIILLAIMATVVSTSINEFTFGAILILLIVAQILFMGIIKSRRPTVAI